MKIDRDEKTLIKTGEAVEPVSQFNSQTSANQGPAEKQADGFPSRSSEASPGFWSSNGEAEFLMAKLAQIPETRGEKLASIEHSIQKGNYQVSPERTAGAIVSEMEAREQQESEVDKAGEKKDDMIRPNGALSGPAKPMPEPLILYSHRESGPTKGRPNALSAPHSNDFREDSEPSSRQMESDVADRDLMEG
jgi:anti-sigma28 factor (negative regulator of flagellin synthesis)